MVPHQPLWTPPPSPTVPHQPLCPPPFPFCPRVGQGLDVTVFFYNPNIHPKEEYEIRKEENKRFADELGIPFVDADYDADEWFRRAKGMEFCPERGTRSVLLTSPKGCLLQSPF